MDVHILIFETRREYCIHYMLEVKYIPSKGSLKLWKIFRKQQVVPGKVAAIFHATSSALHSLDSVDYTNIQRPTSTKRLSVQVTGPKGYSFESNGRAGLFWSILSGGNTEEKPGRQNPSLTCNATSAAIFICRGSRWLIDSACSILVGWGLGDKEDTYRETRMVHPTAAKWFD